jgi:hypothetical protein
MDETSARGRMRTRGSTGVHEEAVIASSAGSSQPTTLPRTRALVARRPIAAFLIMTYVIGWATQLSAPSSSGSPPCPVFGPAQSSAC